LELSSAARKYEKSSSYTKNTKKQRDGAGRCGKKRKSFGSHCQLPSSVSIVCDSLGDVILPYHVAPPPRIPLQKDSGSRSAAPAHLLLPFSVLVALFAFYELPCTGKVATLWWNEKERDFPLPKGCRIVTELC